MSYRNLKFLIGRTAAVSGAAAMLALMITGCSHDITPPPDNGIAQTPPPPTDNPGTPTVQQPQSNSGAVVAYKLASNGAANPGDVNGLVATPVTMPSGSISPARAALTQLTEGSNSPLPQGTRVLGVKIDTATKLATVDFSRQFKSNFQGGDTAEAQAVDSVLETLGQFQTIQKVQFLVEGRKIESLGGSQDLAEPLPTPQSTRQIASSAGTGGN